MVSMFLLTTILIGLIIFLGFVILDRIIRDIEKKDRVGIVGQWIAGAISGAGLGYEIATGADLGFVLITLGSIIFAGATKCRKI